MALIKTIITDRGVVYPDQYCRVDRVDASKTDMRFSVGIYLSAETAIEGQPPHRMEEYQCPYNLFGDNPWIQAYTTLKTYWPDAVDA